MSETSDPGRKAEWTEEEARALRDLASDEALVSLPPGLRPRVIESLKASGLLTSARRSGAPSWLPWTVTVTAAAACALIGFGLGRQSAGSAAVEGQIGGTAGGAGRTAANIAGGGQGQRYMLLLTGAPARTPEDNASRQKEYGDWARQPQMGGTIEEGAELVGPQKLGDPAQSDVVVGYFVIAARDEREALSIAETSPHLRHGGGVTLAALR